MQSNICISYLILLCNCHEDTAPTPLIFIFYFLNRICVNFSLHLMSTALKPEKGGRLRWIISTASMKLLKYALYAHVWNVCVCVCIAVYVPFPNLGKIPWCLEATESPFFGGLLSVHCIRPRLIPTQFYCSCRAVKKIDTERLEPFFVLFCFCSVQSDCSTDTGLDWINYFLARHPRSKYYAPVLPYICSFCFA